jgi:endonuclease/exonuclease/phosphatase family metal-dependent hydrolase
LKGGNNIYTPSAGMAKNSFHGGFISFLEQFITDSRSLIIFGDFNLHIDSPNDAAAIMLIDLLETFGLKQHINVAIHQSGYTLDSVITRSDDDLVSRFDVTDPVISDHMAVHCKITLRNHPSSIRKSHIATLNLSTSNL